MIKDILTYLASAGVGGIILYLLGWIRFKPKDTADTDKLKAEAQEIRAKADVLITDGALRIVERLSKDLDEARDEIEKLLLIAGELKALHEKAKVDHLKETEDLRAKIAEARTLIDIKRRHCIDIKLRLTQLQDLLLLKQQGLSQKQLEEFINKLNELINSEPLEIPTNLSS